MPFSVNRRNSRRSVAGFTLVEVIVVIAIFGILAAIGFPTLMKWVPNYRLKAAAQEMYGNLQKAKMDAIKTNSKVTIKFTPDAACSPSGGGGYTFKNDESNQVIASATFSNGICLSSSTFSASSDGFDPRGLPKDLSGFPKNVKLKNPRIDRTYTISQTLSGAIQVK